MDGAAAPHAAAAAAPVRGRAGAGGGVAGAGRVKAKLGAAMTAGNYYEAHQMYRTLFYRQEYHLMA